MLWYLDYALQQKSMQREDSATDASTLLPLPNIQRFASLSMLVEKDYIPMLREASTNMWAMASEVLPIES